ncbi:MAG: sigma-70 family RNA polymerase sigma factor, partial [Nocardioidaceae bacterium]
MTELLSDIETPSDAELISRVRGGDAAAYGELFSRHVQAATRLSRQLVRGPDADDLVSEAFAKVLSVLQGGGGPDVAFRAYLLTAVRRLHVDKIRSGAKLHTTDDLTPFDPGVPFQDTAVAGFESGAAAQAFASLPERWQLVLWHLEVEGQKPADIAPLLGMSPNSVSALAYRAREGLRQAFLTMHLSDISETECRWVNEHLGAFVRNGLSKRDSGKVQAHLDECRRCTAMYLELTDVNSNLAGIIAPMLLGAAATGYVASSGGAGATGVLSLLGRARDVVVAHTGVATVGAVAAGVAAAATAGFVFMHTASPSEIGADRPIGTTHSAAPASPGPSSPSSARSGRPSPGRPAAPGRPGVLAPS